MAQVFPFRAFRYNPTLVRFEGVLTQPYDKITPAMQDRYYAGDPHNLITVEKGRSHSSDTTQNNVYTRAAAALSDWIRGGILRQDPAPAFYAYSQEYTVPGTEERRIRRGFIGAGRLEEYSAGVVFRHEQTLSGPKVDRLELLRHTQTHTGQLFMLYADPRRRVDEILAEAESSTPDTELCDEYGVLHRLWIVSRPRDISEIQRAMAERKLVIADGHHRYETALAYRDECRASARKSDRGFQSGRLASGRASRQFPPRPSQVRRRSNAPRARSRRDGRAIAPTPRRAGTSNRGLPPKRFLSRTTPRKPQPAKDSSRSSIAPDRGAPSESTPQQIHKGAPSASSRSVTART